MRAGSQDTSDGERGTTLVEYALVVALVATVAAGAIRATTATIGTMFGTVKRDIAVGDGPEVAGTTTVPTSTPPTTSAPTTMPVTTTTIRPTTTTTAPATTTTTAPKGGGATFSQLTATSSGYFWNASGSLVLRDTIGRPIAGATVTLTVRYPVKDWFGGSKTQETTVQVTTGSDGTASIDVGPFVRGSGAFSTSAVELSVTGATLPKGLAWDGEPATTSVSQP